MQSSASAARWTPPHKFFTSVSHSLATSANCGCRDAARKPENEYGDRESDKEQSTARAANVV
jgi:hypothetical protein